MGTGNRRVRRTVGRVADHLQSARRLTVRQVPDAGPAEDPPATFSVPLEEVRGVRR
jgi:hypothetical protein